jgi:hypothetical protein
MSYQVGDCVILFEEWPHLKCSLKITKITLEFYHCQTCGPEPDGTRLKTHYWPREVFLKRARLAPEERRQFDLLLPKPQLNPHSSGIFYIG